MSDKITHEKILAAGIARVMYCDQPGEHSKEELIEALCKKYLDEAIAHGMTLSADCAISDSLMNHHDPEGRCICGNCSARRAILTARDNKIWRKE